MENFKNPTKNLTIGELSRLTGITTHTLRMWEKRYGSPESLRLPSGHRRYPREEVPRLRAVAKALESGYRASRVVRGTLEELQSLLGLNMTLNSRSSALGKQDPEGMVQAEQVMIQKWIEAVHKYDDQVLSQGFHELWGKHGPLKFVTKFAIPFIQQVGLSWETGELNVSQEHFGSERLSDFLSTKWRQLNDRKDGKSIILTTLPEEPHRIGIQMCAVVTAITKFKVIYLGPDTPIPDMVSAVKASKAKILSISVSSSMSIFPIEENLYRIRSSLPKEVLIAVGGEGAPRNIAGLNCFEDFSRYHQWLLEME